MIKRKSSTKIKNRVSRDFNATLQTIIRSVSREEINIRDAFEQPNQAEEFYLSNPLDAESSSSTSRIPKRTKSIFRNKSFKNYELVVDTAVNDAVTTRTQSKDDSRTRIYTQPIWKAEATEEMKKKSNKSKTPTHLQRFFPTSIDFALPFHTTRIDSLQYHLRVETEHKGKLQIQVSETYTIDHLKSKIFKESNIDIEKQALYFKGTRLEGQKILFTYGIHSHSQVVLKESEKITVHGIFKSQRISHSLYTSVTVRNMKRDFAKEIGLDPISIKLKYNNSPLDENKELFVYDIKNDAEIVIDEVVRSRKYSESKAYQDIEHFFQLTENLKKCKCRILRITVMSDLYQLLLKNSSPDEEIQRKRQFLNEFDQAQNGDHYHHKSCFKLSPRKSRTESQGSCDSEISIADFSGSDNSVKSAILAENLRVNKDENQEIEDQFIKNLAECKDFKMFKHLFRKKIGTQCSLRSVALLYRYTREIVRYIGFEENEKNPEVEKILGYTKEYFHKYFLKEIVNKGGLDALILAEAEVD